MPKRKQTTLFDCPSWNIPEQPAKKVKRSATESEADRKFRPEWKNKFPFVRFDKDCQSMFCVLCERSGRQNIWATSGCNKFKTDAIQKHAKTSDHLFSIEADNNSGDIDRAAQRAAEKDREAVQAVMANIYYLAHRNEPVSAISDFNNFLVHQKISTMQPLKREGKFMYEHNVSVREMQNAMTQVVNEDLLDDIKHSGVFSIMADESTDVSTEKTLMLYIRYVKDGAPNVKFLDVTELSGDECNSKSICETILRVMNSYNLSISDMSCITTDGASVMTGHRGGVTTLLKEKNGQLLSIHCIAHRLALASGQTADKIPYLKKYQAMLNTIFKYFNYSPKHLSKLSKIQQVFDLSERKFRQTFHTRWLSFEGAVDAVIANYDALVCCLEMDVAEEDDPTARGLLSFVTDYQFLATSYMLSDVLSNLCLMSKVFQKRELDLATFVLTTTSSIETLKTLRTTAGPNQKQFESMLPDDYETGFDFGALKHRIKNTKKQCEQFVKVKCDYLDLLIKNLQSRFEDNSMISNFSVFNPLNIPDSEQLCAFGNLEIQQLGQFYACDSQSSHLSVDPVELATEWPVFRQLMDRKYRGKTLVHMTSDFLPNSDYDMLFPNIKKLLKLSIVMPVSSADCERGFSRYNLIKTTLRNRLKTDSVNVMLKMTVDTPSIVNMEQFNFDRAFDLWVKQKNRRF